MAADRIVLQRLIARARNEHPAFGVVSDDELSEFVLARVPEERINARDESLVLIEDLLLACACVKGVRAAHDALWEAAAPDVDRAYARIRPNSLTPAEARNAVLDRLLVAPEGGVARIALYKGEGSLAAFVRSVATRLLLNAASGKKGPEPLEESILRVTPAADADPELQLVKKRYLSEFKSAFAAVANTLEPRERALLRYAIVEELTVDTIGRMYGVHRATAARWVQAAREKLELRVKKHLAERLRVSDRDLASAARCVTSQLDLSLARALAE